MLLNGFSFGRRGLAAKKHSGHKETEPLCLLSSALIQQIRFLCVLDVKHFGPVSVSSFT